MIIGACLSDDAAPTCPKDGAPMGTMFAHVGAAAAGRITALDTYWIWQEGQRLTVDPLKIGGARINVPQKPGLGIEADMDAIEPAHQRYLSKALGVHDDIGRGACAASLPQRASDYGRVKEYALCCEEELGVLVPAETAHALANIESIAAVACAAHGGKAWDQSAMVRALETMANYEIGAKPPQ